MARRAQTIGQREAFRAVLTPLDGVAVPCGYLKLSTPPPSLNNLFATSGKVRVKSAEYKHWLWVSAGQIRKQEPWHVPGKTCVSLTFDRTQTRADLDNLIKPVLDLLVLCGRIEDDKNVVDVRAKFSGQPPGTEINVAKVAV